MGAAPMLLQQARAVNRALFLAANDCSFGKKYFDLSGRKWHIDAGDSDLPCGEVYIAPIEGGTHGSVFFEKLYIEECGVFECVKFSVENGRITGSDNKSVNAFVSGMGRA